MKPTVFLDTNVILRHLLQDIPDQSAKATAFLKSIEEGRVVVATTDTVVFETVFVLERHYRHSKAEVHAALLPLFELPGIVLPGKRRLRRVFSLYADSNVPFADAHHAVVMERLGIKSIATFDRDFDRIPGITRIQFEEPG